MALVYIAIAIVCASFGARSIVTPYADGDLFWQKHLGAYVLDNHSLPQSLGGEAFAAVGAPWVPQEWLLGIAASLAISHHVLWVLALAAAAAVALAMLLAVARARRFGSGIIGMVVCVVLLSLDLQGSFGIRAQVFAWPFFAALLLLLDLDGPIVFLVWPVVALWANEHASAALAIPFVWIDAVYRVMRDGIGSGAARARLLLAVTVPFALFATPLGARLPLYALALVHSPIRSSISEWMPLTFKDDFFWTGAFPMLVAVAFAIRTLLRERPRDLVYIALLTAMTISAVRNAALLGIALMPVACRALDILLSRFSVWRIDPLRSTGPRRLAIVGGIVLIFLTFDVMVHTPPPKKAFIPPIATFERIAAVGGERRVFCYDFAVCSIGLDYPIRVFMDGRADPFPLPLWRAFNTIRYAKPSWKALVNAYDINTILAKRDDSLDKALKKEPGWQRVPAPDKCCDIFVRRD